MRANCSPSIARPSAIEVFKPRVTAEIIASRSARLARQAVDCILRLRKDIRLVGHLFERGFEDTLAHRTAVVRCCDGVAIRLGLWAESLSMSIGTIPRARARGTVPDSGLRTVPC